MNIIPSLSVLSLALISSFGPASAAHDAGFYLGGNLGEARATIDDERIIEGLLDSGFATTSFSTDERDLGYKLFGGYRFGRYFALEAGYFDLGEFDFDAVTDPPGTVEGRIEIQGFNLDAVGFLPFTERFSGFARVGANHAESDVRFIGTGAANVLEPKRRERDTNVKYGLGLQYDFTQALSARLEGERYRIDDAVGNTGDIDLASLGLLYRFGTHPAVAPVVYSAPPAAPVIAAAPPPAPVAPPPPPLPTKVSFEADALFDFDQATLKPQGRQALDTFAGELRGMRYDTISVVGHTDRIGTSAYNQDLSLRRAHAVRDYLASSAGIPVMNIQARGAGDAEPATRADQCPGTQKTPQRIACLQPDRRVEVEVTATK